MSIKVTEKNSVVTITDTDFEFVRELIGDSRRAHGFSRGGRYNGFENQYKDWSSPEEAQAYNSKLAIANFVLAHRLWKEAIYRINEYMRTQTNSPNKKYVAKVYGNDYVEETEEVSE